jgi:4-hydroxy-3-methylbut-2-enyl diphosphate reductase IspH
MSAETYRDDPDSRIANMELVLDEAENNMIEGINSMIDSTIGAYVDCKDWSKIAEWNFDSIYGGMYRHNEMCNMSLDKTKEKVREATRDDVGTEITKNKLSSLLFITQAQTLNVRRSQLIVDTLEKKYKEIFGKSYVPVSNRKSATDSKDVNTAEKSMLKSELLKLVK